jgi:hypothetical protein
MFKPGSSFIQFLFSEHLAMRLSPPLPPLMMILVVGLNLQLTTEAFFNTSIIRVSFICNLLGQRLVHSASSQHLHSLTTWRKCVAPPQQFNNFWEALKKKKKSPKMLFTPQLYIHICLLLYSVPFNLYIIIYYFT